MVELGLKKSDLRVGGFEFGTLAGAFFLKCFDALVVAGSAPTTRFLILYRKENSVPFIPWAHLRTAQVDAIEEELQGFRGKGQGGGSRPGCGGP